MVLSLILLVIIVFLLLALSMVWPPDSPWAPWWRTNKKTARAALKLADVKSTDVIYELGSGDAEFLIVAAKEFKVKRATGIEIDPLRVFISKFKINKSRISNNVKIVRKNFFNIDLSDADVIFAYLVPKTLKSLKSKFLKELKPGTKIISFRYKTDLPLKEYDKKNNIYLYTIPKNTSKD